NSFADLSLDQPQKLRRADDFNAERLFQFQQILVVADDKTRARRQRGGQIRIVLCVAAALLAEWRGSSQTDDGKIPVQTRGGIMGKIEFSDQPGASFLRLMQGDFV